jgi:hypothetical protein
MLKKEFRFEIGGAPPAGLSEIPLNPIGLVIFGRAPMAERRA